MKAAVLGKRHGVSLKISDIAANEDGGEESEEGKSESEEEMDQEEDEEKVSILNKTHLILQSVKKKIKDAYVYVSNPFLTPKHNAYIRI